MCLVGLPQSLMELFHVVKKTWFSREVNCVVSCSGARITVQLPKPCSCHNFICAEAVFTGPIQRNLHTTGLEPRLCCWVGGGLQPCRESWAPAPSSQAGPLQDHRPAVNLALHFMLGSKTPTGCVFLLNKTFTQQEISIFVLEKDTPTPTHAQWHTLMFRDDL